MQIGNGTVLVPVWWQKGLKICWFANLQAEISNNAGTRPFCLSFLKIEKSHFQKKISQKFIIWYDARSAFKLMINDQYRYHYCLVSSYKESALFLLKFSCLISFWKWLLCNQFQTMEVMRKQNIFSSKHFYPACL